MEQAAIQKTIRGFIIENFMYAADAQDLTDELHLFDNGIIDSTGVLELAEFLEESYSFKVDDAEMVPEHFESIKAVASYVCSKVG